MQNRQFSDYDSCPLIYYRFNKIGELGPERLNFVAHTKLDEDPTAMVECRFSDENNWRPQVFFKELWTTIPASEKLKLKLIKAGYQFSENITEPEAREIWRKVEKTKPPTAVQRKRLESYGVDPAIFTTREQAEQHISEWLKYYRDLEEYNRAIKLENERFANTSAYNELLEKMTPCFQEIQTILPDWTPILPPDLKELKDYFHSIQHAIDNYLLYSAEELDVDFFYDFGRDADYLLTFPYKPTEEEVVRLKKAMLSAYFESNSSEFDHVKILKKVFPSVILEKTS